MKLINRNQLTTRILIMYMVSALLFLTSIDLHIHAHNGKIIDGKVSADHAAQFHISSISDEVASVDNSDEISISPSGVLKHSENSFILLAIILLTVLITLCRNFACINRLRDIQLRLPSRPFHGTPTLRAPPVFNS